MSTISQAMNTGPGADAVSEAARERMAKFVDRIGIEEVKDALA